MNHSDNKEYEELDKKYQYLLKKYDSLNKRFDTIIKHSDNQLSKNIKDLALSQIKNKRTDTIIKHSDNQLNKLLKDLASYIRFDHRLDTIIKHSDKQGKKILKEKLNVEEELYKELAINEENNKLIAHQSKMAAIGEMIENITHQMKQPLSTISMVSSGQQLKYENNTSIGNDISKDADMILNAVEHLSSTIDSFKSFFSEDKHECDFYFKDMIQSAKQLLSAKIKHKDINFILNVKDEKIFGIPNEFIHIILNLISNSIDALEDKNYTRYIFIDIYNENENVIIKIKDNAKGIKDNLLLNIFEAHFTTKGDNGSGVGLYMTKQIIEKSYHGTIDAKNKKFKYNDIEYSGLEFTIELPII